MRWTIAILLFLAAGVWAQQANQPKASEDDRIDAFEKRLELVEKAVTQENRTATSPASVSLEARLSRIETRLDQLERYALRGTTAGSAGDRMLESRVRALERQVSSLKRF